MHATDHIVRIACENNDQAKKITSWVVPTLRSCAVLESRTIEVVLYFWLKRNTKHTPYKKIVEVASRFFLLQLMVLFAMLDHCYMTFANM